MDYELTALTASLGVSLVATVFVYLLVPCVILFTGKKYKAKTIKRITIINCIICWLLFLIIQFALGMEPRSSGAVFLWGGIGYLILKKKCLKKDVEETPVQTEPIASAPPIDSTESSVSVYSLSDPDEEHPKSIISREISGQDVMYCPETQFESVPNVAPAQKSEESFPPVAPTEHSETPVAQPEKAKVKYCSKCGSIIDGKTKKCTGCGKQYFKGIPWKAVCNIAVVLLLIGSIAGNVLLYKEKTALDGTIAELEEQTSALNSRIEQYIKNNKQLQNKKTNLERDLAKAEREIAFYDKYVVFVGDDGTRLYHNYRCDRRGGDGFWAFNISAAVGDGYKPCPFCCGEDSSSFTSDYLNALNK